MSIGMLYANISYKRYFSDAMVQVAQKLLDKMPSRGRWIAWATCCLPL